MAPPLVTLLSAESEIQYVALRNINLIVQKNPGILAHEVKVGHSAFVARVCMAELQILSPRTVASFASTQLQWLAYSGF